MLALSVGRDGNDVRPLVALVGAVLVGLAVAFGGLVGVGLAIVCLVVVAVAVEPTWGIAAVLLATPLAAGFERGAVVPLLRPHEVVLGLVIAGVGVRVLRDYQYGRPLEFDWQPLDRAFLILALAGSIIPLLLAYGRGRTVDADGLAQLVILPKYFALFIVVRIVIRRKDDVRRALLLTVVVGFGLAILGVVQALSNERVADVLVGLGYQETDYLLAGRGTATIGNAIAFGTLMALHLAVALALLFRHLGQPFADGRRRKLWTAGLTLVSGAFFVGAIASGQFSGVVAAIIAIVAVSLLARRARYLLAFPAVALLGLVAVWPQVSARLEEFGGPSGLPPSWESRVDNLRRFFLPELGTDWNWAFGVRPNVTASFDQRLGGEVFLESGYLWLLWVGGVVLFGAAIAFLVVAARSTLERTQLADPWTEAAAVGAFSALIYISFLMLIDQHLTLRASTDLFVTLLALSSAGAIRPWRASMRAADADA
ncbi:MAG: hypothetical protein V3V01_18215 [Acidimicrobiales bacterium]